MVVFGAPEKLKNHENRAVECSLKMNNQLKELNIKWDENKLSRYWKNHGIDSIKMRNVSDVPIANFLQVGSRRTNFVAGSKKYSSPCIE